MANPLAMRPKTATSANHCPFGYGDPQAWCNWRNSEIGNTGSMWIVGPNGTPMLVDDDAVSARRRKDEFERREAERKRFNWRLQHPVTEAR